MTDTPGKHILLNHTAESDTIQKKLKITKVYFYVIVDPADSVFIPALTAKINKSLSTHCSS